MKSTNAFLFSGAGAAFLILAGLVNAVPAQAESTNAALQKCGSNNKATTIRCCETVLRTHKRPYWMGSEGSCSKAASCGGGGGVEMTLSAAPKSGKSAKVAKVKPLCIILLQPVGKDLEEAKPVSKGRQGG